MGFSFSKFRRAHESPPRPERPSSSPIPSVSLPPPPSQPALALPPPPHRQRPPPTSTQPAPPPPPPPPAYPYPAPGTYSAAPRTAPYYQYPPPPPTYAPYAPSPYSYPAPYGCQPPAPPHYSQFVGYYNNRWYPPAAAGPSAAVPPPYVDHKTAKKIKNEVNVHKDAIKLSIDEQSPDSHLVSFTFDALVDGSITVIYFAKEGPNCTFSPIYPEIHKPQRIPFQKGLGQKFQQPSGSGIDLGFFDIDELSKPSQNEEIFPLVIYAETSAPSLMDEQPNQPVSSVSSHAQITECVLVKGNEGNFQVRVIKQILWIEGDRYELREIFGISNVDEKGFEDSDPGKECVICMTEPKDTAVLPCRHMCLCGECAKELRLQSNKCPICRQPIEELLGIKVNNASSS
ncbi:probable E3 ubiquitin-protein ligase LUL4 [Punica granatum]|uniref:RING-type E3 ubiquitin transferase n=1 Tax=Punica granatum TaxID=22663 RepID=A0A6P8CEB9_PUNGR|nr:probable E3 ubiquitin-protein ligase LUL4 [Punica granatum]